MTSAVRALLQYGRFLLGFRALRQSDKPTTWMACGLSSCCLGTRSCSRRVPVLLNQRLANRLLLPLRLSPPPSRRNLQANPPIGPTLLFSRRRTPAEGRVRRLRGPAPGVIPDSIGAHRARPAWAHTVRLLASSAGPPVGSGIGGGRRLSGPFGETRVWLAKPSQRSHRGSSRSLGFPKLQHPPSRLPLVGLPLVSPPCLRRRAV